MAPPADQATADQPTADQPTADRAVSARTDPAAHPDPKASTAFTEPVPLTRPPVLLVLLLAVVLITAGSLATAFATVTTQVKADGMLIAGGSFFPVVAPATGQVTAVQVAIGDALEAGQQVGVIATADGQPMAITTAQAGTVAQLILITGTVIAAGTPVLQLVATGAPLTAVAFAPVDKAASITIGAAARMYPEGSTTNDTSYIQATVTGISSFVADPDQVAVALGSTALSAQYTSDGAVRELTITPVPDPADPTGMAWSPGSRSGAPVQSGMLVTVDVITGDAPLITLLTRR